MKLLLIFLMLGTCFISRASFASTETFCNLFEEILEADTQLEH